MAAPSTSPKLTHLGSNFFTVHANLEEMLADEARTQEALELIWLVSNAQTIRGAQFSCGTILTKGDDIVPSVTIASDEFAAEHGIIQSYGQADWNIFRFCDHQSLEKRQETMRVFMRKIPELAASVERLIASLKAKQAA